MKRWSRWLIGLCLLTIACSPTPIDPSLLQTPTSPEPAVAAPLDRLTAYLSEQTRIPTASLRVERVEAVNWSDACLGLAQPNEVCAQVMTPGFRAELTASEKRYVLHSDRAGRSIRLKP